MAENNWQPVRYHETYSSVPERLNQSGFYWQDVVAVALAEPQHNQHFYL